MTDQLKITIGRKIKAARSLRSITQERLAELADCHTDSLSLIERGKTLPSIDLLLRICDELSVDLTGLLNRQLASKNAKRAKAEADLWALVEQAGDIEVQKLRDIAGTLFKRD